MISKMILKESESRKPVRVKNGNQYSLEALRSAFFTKLTNEYGYNVEVTIDQVSSGKFFDKSKKDCIVIVNKDHRNDYNYHVITFSVQGIFGLFDFYIGGNSKNAARIRAGEESHSTITGSIIGSLKKAMVKNDALDAEDTYFSAVDDVIGEILGI